MLQLKHASKSCITSTLHAPCIRGVSSTCADTGISAVPAFIQAWQPSSERAKVPDHSDCRGWDHYYTFRSFLRRKANSAAAPRSMARLVATSFRGSAPGAFPIAPITCVVAMAAPIDALRVKKPKNTRRSALHQCVFFSVGFGGPFMCIHFHPPRQVSDTLMLLETC